MKRWCAAALVAAALTLVGCNSSKASSGGSAPFRVSGPIVHATSVEAVRSYKFSPAAIAVHRGQTVTWTNHDDFPHTVQLVGTRKVTESLGLGKTATIAFPDAGTFYYRCSIHPQQMHGEVVVS